LMMRFLLINGKRKILKNQSLRKDDSNYIVYFFCILVKQFN
jgi:hypothetical protein